MVTMIFGNIKTTTQFSCGISAVVSGNYLLHSVDIAFMCYVSSIGYDGGFVFKCGDIYGI